MFLYLKLSCINIFLSKISLTKTIACLIKVKAVAVLTFIITFAFRITNLKTII